jgi:hypothetical protein
MSERLRDFLVDLASRPELMSRFSADPAAVLAQAGLTSDESAAVLARDSDRLRAALGASVADHLTHVLARRKGGRKRTALRKPLRKKPAPKTPARKKGRKAKKR